MSVSRYSFQGEYGYMEYDPEGDYVNLEDYQAVEDELKEIKRALRDNLPHLANLMRMPNIEHVADEHNDSIKALRKLLETE